MLKIGWEAKIRSCTRRYFHCCFSRLACIWGKTYDIKQEGRILAVFTDTWFSKTTYKPAFYPRRYITSFGSWGKLVVVSVLVPVFGVHRAAKVKILPWRLGILQISAAAVKWSWTQVSLESMLFPRQTCGHRTMCWQWFLIDSIPWRKTITCADALKSVEW